MKFAPTCARDEESPPIFTTGTGPTAVQSGHDFAASNIIQKALPVT